MFQQKYTNSTGYEYLKIKLKEYLNMHHQNKRNRRKRVKKKQSLAWTHSSLEEIF